MPATAAMGWGPRDEDEAAVALSCRVYRARIKPRGPYTLISMPNNEKSSAAAERGRKKRKKLPSEIDP